MLKKKMPVSKSVACLSALIPVYFTISSAAPLLTKEGKQLLTNPFFIFFVSYGTAFAATGDARVTMRVCTLCAVVAYYLKEINPSYIKKFLKDDIVKDNLGSDEE